MTESKSRSASRSGQTFFGEDGSHMKGSLNSYEYPSRWWGGESPPRRVRSTSRHRRQVLCLLCGGEGRADRGETPEFDCADQSDSLWSGSILKGPLLCHATRTAKSSLEPFHAPLRGGCQIGRSANTQTCPFFQTRPVLRLDGVTPSLLVQRVSTLSLPAPIPRYFRRFRTADLDRPFAQALVVISVRSRCLLGLSERVASSE